MWVYHAARQSREEREGLLPTKRRASKPQLDQEKKITTRALQTPQEQQPFLPPPPRLVLKEQGEGVSLHAAFNNKVTLAEDTTTEPSVREDEGSNSSKMQEITLNT